MINRCLWLSLVCGCLLLGCHRSERVTLSIDFAKADTWRYLLGVDINGTVKTGAEDRSYSSSLRTYLTAGRTGVTANDSNSIHFKTSETVITASFMDEQDRKNLARELENNTLYFSAKNGTFNAADTSLKPHVNIGGWNLFRSFARVVPVLPESPVRVGATWDRERTFPLETDHGNATGWLYQSFTLDSVAHLDSLRCAFISWSFSYRIQPDKTDTATMLDSLPLKGAGNGTAVLDLESKVLIKANALFDVPAAAAALPSAPLKASWQESVHLELVN